MQEHWQTLKGEDMSHVCRDIVASGICFKRLDIYFQQFRTCNINSWSRHQTRRELEHQSRSLHCHADSLSLAILSRLPFHIESHMKRSDGCDKVGGETWPGANGLDVGCPTWRETSSVADASFQATSSCAACTNIELQQPTQIAAIHYQVSYAHPK